MGEDSVALVTGASSGIGREIAKQLLVGGFVVYGAARRVDEMADLKAIGAIALTMDVTKEDDVFRAARRLGA